MGWPSPDEIVEELHALPHEDDGSSVFERLRREDPVRFRAEIEPVLRGGPPADIDEAVRGGWLA